MSPEWWDAEMLGFDLETTGIDVENDRIVTAQLGGIGYLCNPGVPIPAGATEIHGVTDEDAARGWDPPSVLEALHEKILEATDAGVPIVGFNLAYDLTLLDREFRRHTPHLRLPFGMLVLDGFVLDKHVEDRRRGSRKLVDVAAHWGVNLLEAHTAEADSNAAVAVVRAIGRKHGARQPGSTSPFLTTNIGILQAEQQRWRFEQCRSLEQYLRRNDPSVVVSHDWPVTPVWKVES